MASGLIILLICISSAIYCHTEAKRRGLSPVLWGTLGAVVGPLAIPFLFLSEK